MARRVDELSDRIRGLEHSVNGNGKVGLSELVRNQVAAGVRMERAIGELTAKVNGLIGDRDRAAAERMGADKKLNELRRLLIIVGSVLAMLQTGGFESFLNFLRQLLTP